MFSHRRLPTSHDPLLTKSRFGWIMGGGGGGGREHIYGTPPLQNPRFDCLYTTTCY